MFALLRSPTMTRTTKNILCPPLQDAIRFMNPTLAKEVSGLEWSDFMAPSECKNARTISPSGTLGGVFCPVGQTTFGAIPHPLPLLAAGDPWSTRELRTGGACRLHRPGDPDPNRNDKQLHTFGNFFGIFGNFGIFWNFSGINGR